jgi:hypothetical protein
MSVGYLDPAFQVVEAYNTNSSVGVGRLITRNNVITTYGPGSTVDFIVRSWSANAGYTWAAALATWNNGSPLTPMFIGTSTVGNNYLMPGDFPTWPLFGLTQNAGQVPGFDMSFVPEPTSLALAVLGAMMLRLFWLPSRRASN